jgi:uncharacterized membrane protein YbhN (UPF0104 family)
VVPERFRGPWVRVLGGLLAVATVVFTVLAVVDRWDDLVDLVRDADATWLVAAVLAYAGAEAMYAFTWPATLRRMGHPVPAARGAAAFQLAQMGKFVPGGIWPAVGRVGTAGRLGLAPRVVTAGWTFETAVTVAATVLITGVSGGASHLLFDDVGAPLRALEVVLAVVGAGAALAAGQKAATKVAQGPIIERRQVPVVLVWHLAVWLAYSSGAGLITVALGGPFWPTIGAFTVSWLAGFVVIGAPAGLGVREAVMTAALTPAAGSTTALAVALGSRAVWTVVSLALAAVALPTLGRAGSGDARAGLTG